ncbi:putative porin [Flavobacterium sp.]|uniref:putative porin n=1 Tax=Flavobacterium sp. TaxID=239 RepID=UPI003528B298
MRNFFLFFLFFPFCTVISQIGALDSNGNVESQDTIKSLRGTGVKEKKPPIDLYKIYTIQRDTTYVDTTLSINKEYKFNLLRKDIFGLMPFANEGHTYNTLDFNYKPKSANPNFGFTAKHFNYLEYNDINYYQVPTPLTDLYYKSVMEQGQTLDAFLTVNANKQLNFSIAYRGLRSIGKYINNITSSGNFRFTTSYFTKDKRYFLNTHFTSQDILNQENGGITNTALFESSEDPYNERERLEVFYNDAETLLKGLRVFVDHNFKLSKTNPNSLVIYHQFNHEYKFFDFDQPTPSPRLGASYSNTIKNKTRFNQLYNKLGIGFTTEKYGNAIVFVENNTYNYFYNNIIYDQYGNIAVPNAINDKLTSIGANYHYNLNNIKLNLIVTNAITQQNVSTIEATAKYKVNDDYNFQFKYQKLNTLPNLNYTLYQSDYKNYNWYNNFKNEKRNQFQFTANTKWVNLEANYTILNDYLYFYNTAAGTTTQLLKPNQYNNTINYASIKANKEFKYRKFALDNTILFQNAEQANPVLNVPQIVTRNSLYFSEHVFKKAMFIQTGIVFNYFTSYYANDYNPVLGEFFVQNQQKIGGFPMFDFFINAKVRQTRIFLKAEHFNAAWTGYNYYSAPNYPYRDFMVRFGLVWNFFK